MGGLLVLGASFLKLSSLTVQKLHEGSKTLFTTPGTPFLLGSPGVHNGIKCYQPGRVFLTAHCWVLRCLFLGLGKSIQMCQGHNVPELCINMYH